MIFAIKPFEIHDGDGIRTTLFFKGCPLRCKWCHNPESFSPKKQILFDRERCIDCMRCTALCDANAMQENRHVFLRNACTLCGLCAELCPKSAFELCGVEPAREQIAAELLKDETFMRGSGGGVTFSGGEPLLQADLCIEIAKLLKARDIHIAVDTCAYVPKAVFDKIIPFTDIFLFDVKAIDETVHVDCTGVSNKQILENIRYVDSLGIPMEIRYPYVPTMNDGEAEKIADFAKALRHVKCVRILPYHDYAVPKYERLGIPYPLSTVSAPTREEIAQVAERMRGRGLTTLADPQE